MSRSLERSAKVVGASNSYWQILDVPAGHKYEVLELFYENVAAGDFLGPYVAFASGGVDLILPLLTLPAGASYTINQVLQSFVLYAGNELWGIVVGPAKNVTMYVTYVDVDYTD